MSVVVFITFYDHYGCHGNVSVAIVKQHEVERVLTLAVDWLNIWMGNWGCFTTSKSFKYM